MDIVHNFDIEVTFTPDGVSSIANVIVRSGPRARPFTLEFYVETADEDTMFEAAQAFVRAWLDANGSKLVCHEWN